MTRVIWIAIRTSRATRVIASRAFAIPLMIVVSTVRVPIALPMTISAGITMTLTAVVAVSITTVVTTLVSVATATATTWVVAVSSTLSAVVPIVLSAISRGAPRTISRCVTEVGAERWPLS